METRANYVLIGLFTVAAILAGLGFFVWLARVQVDRQYDYYDVLFDSVSGLSRSSDVRFNGLPVGQVVSLGLYDRDRSRVRVRVEVAGGTPVTESTTAQLAAQGVTGVSYVALSSGRPDAGPLVPVAGQQIAIIEGRRSVVQQITQDAPDVLAETLKLMSNLQELLGADNQARVASILQNVDDASGALEATLRDFSDVSGTISRAAGQIGDFTDRLAPVGTALQSALTSAETTLEVARGTFTEAETTLAAATRALDQAGSTLRGADTIIRADVPGIVADLRQTVAGLRSTIDEVGRAASGTITGFGTTADLANARLSQLESTIDDLDRTLAGADATFTAVETASESFDQLIDGEGAALVDDARKAFAQAETSIEAIDRVMTDDVPAIVADIRTAVATANRAIGTVGQDVTTFTTGLAPLTSTADETLRTATTTLENANRTLGVLDRALGSAEGTLAAAETTFTSANRIIDEEVASTAADIRAASARLATAVEQVSADVPAVTADLRRAIAQASDVIARVDAVVAAAAPPVQDFAETGLPQFVRFTQEARALTAQLDRIAVRLERDPARFLLGGQAPEFRR